MMVVFNSLLIPFFDESGQYCNIQVSSMSRIDKILAIALFSIISIAALLMVVTFILISLTYFFTGFCDNLNKTQQIMLLLTITVLFGCLIFLN